MQTDLEKMARQLRPALPNTSLIDLKTTFEQIDANKDGHLTAAELKTVFIKINEPVTDAEVAEMIRMYDGDGDGRVNFSDFVRLLTIQPGDFTTELAEEMKNLLEDQHMIERIAAVDGIEASERFRQKRQEERLDKEQARAPPKLTGNVSIDLGNFIRSLAGEGGLTPSYMKRLVQAFRENDTDGSGELDFNEFCRLINKPNDDALALSAFALIDADRSGTIALRELLVGISAFAVAAPEEKIAFAFRLFDEKNTDFLDRATLAQVINANFVAQGGLSDVILDRRIQATYRLAGIQNPNEPISFDQYMYVARTNAGLLFPSYQSLASVRPNFPGQGSPSS